MCNVILYAVLHYMTDYRFYGCLLNGEKEKKFPLFKMHFPKTRMTGLDQMTKCLA